MELTNQAGNQSQKLHTPLSTTTKAAQECKHCNRQATWLWSDDDGNESSAICETCMETIDSYRFSPLRQFLPVAELIAVYHDPKTTAKRARQIEGILKEAGVL